MAKRTPLRTSDHPELIEPGGRKILHRNWPDNAKRPADIPIRIITVSHRHRPPLCCGLIITRTITEADHANDIFTVTRTLIKEPDRS